MRILVYPHDLSIGGSQINAIDLASGISKNGHDVFVYGIPGPLIDYIRQRGLRFIPARRLRYRPAPSRIAQLALLARRERIDLIHAYEWPPCLDAYFGAGLFFGVRILCTVLSMSVMPLVPASVPLIMGTEELGTAARKTQISDVWVLEPPIDTITDHPGIDGSAFREKHGVAKSEFLIVSVSRLALDLKLDALVRSVEAAGLLAQRYSIRLVLVGGGPAYDALMARSSAINARFGRSVVTLTGPMLDPREAYAAADAVVGMGSSALRALAIGKPVVVQGELAFSEVFCPETAGQFMRQGFYGLGTNERGSHRLACQLEMLVVDSERRKALAQYGREMVVKRFSLERGVNCLLDIYTKVVRDSPVYSLPDTFRTTLRALSQELANHNPRLKRNAYLRQQELIAAARHGTWPPAAMDVA